MSRLTNEQMMQEVHTTLSNGWKVLSATGDCWKWNVARNVWENWR